MNPIENPLWLLVWVAIPLVGYLFALGVRAWWLGPLTARLDEQNIVLNKIATSVARGQTGPTPPPPRLD
ncbi:MAG: hypothetical protein JNM10_00245 [Planctomycetia bacterium]|nr:hypothetical protein [Planctomycetia bacterium]